LARKLVIGQHGDMEIFHFQEELGLITLGSKTILKRLESGSAASAWALG
jgi:hypothetical protein